MMHARAAPTPILAHKGGEREKVGARPYSIRCRMIFWMSLVPS